MGKIVELQPQRGIEMLIAEVMGEARRRAQMSPQGFADALNRRSRRRPGITDVSVLGYESGRVVPRVDTYFHALDLTGFDIKAGIHRWLEDDGRKAL